MNKKLFKYFIAIPLLFFISCGEGMVEVGPQTYNPKIVIGGYLQPGKNVEGLYITRNIPLNTEISPENALLPEADVTITDMQNNQAYKLTFNHSTFTFEYNGDDLAIDYGKSYKLSVNAVIDGRNLSCSSVTTVPERGFSLLKNESVLDTMKYRETDNEGNVKEYKVVFNTSPGTSFYAISNIALNASLETFIYDNAYFDFEPDDIDEDIENFKYELRWLQDANPAGGKREIAVPWLDIWFYSDYRFIVYAGDENFRLYVQTARSVQSFDGNFHEPRMNITGDGIGVFGSFIADTVYTRVEK